MSKLNLRVSSRTSKEGKAYFEGTVALPGLKASKLEKQDGSTQYSTAAGVRSAAERLAARFGWTVEVEEAAPAKAAAKRSVRTAACQNDQTCSG